MVEICDLPHLHMVVISAQDKASCDLGCFQIGHLVEDDLEVLILLIPTVECCARIIGQLRLRGFHIC